MLEGPAALSVAQPVMLTASLPSKAVVLMVPWLAVPVAALEARLRASPAALSVASWTARAPRLAPMGPLSTEPVLGKGWFASRASLPSMTGLWTWRIRPFPMGLTVPEHLLADPR